MKPLTEPFASMVAGRPAEVDLRGTKLLAARLFTKDLAFREDEREAFGLRGLLPDQVLTIEEQEQLEWEHVEHKEDDLERYIGLAALQDRNATLFYRLLADHLEDLMPVVYTPTVGQACQQFSHIIRRTRGIWITPADIDRIPQVLRNSPNPDVRLIVVTDNERILGLGDQGAGGMGIPIGKLALYSAAGGVHPSLTLPVSLDVGTDNRQLLDDPLYLGYHARRLRGHAYQELVEAFVGGVEQTWPGCIIQWEDFKGPNALHILDHFRDRVPSFNDDVQGTAAVVLAGLYSAARALGRGLGELRFVLAGSGAAGIGIARLLRRAMVEEGLSPAEAAARIAALDSQGIIHAGRGDLDAYKREVAMDTAVADGLGLVTAGDDRRRLEAVIRAFKPDILIGTTGQPGTFDEAVIGAMAEGAERPVVFALSNPSSRSEATPAGHPHLEQGPRHHRHGQPLPGPDVGRRRACRGPGQQRVHLPGRRPGRRGRRGSHHHGAHVPRRGPGPGGPGPRRAAGAGGAVPAHLRPLRHLAHRGPGGRRRSGGLRGSGHRPGHGPGGSGGRGHVAPQLRALHPLAGRRAPGRGEPRRGRRARRGAAGSGAVESAAGSGAVEAGPPAD